MNTSILKKVAIVAIAALCTVSCSKEVQKTYPAELTLENYEEFLDAPQSVIDALDEKERIAKTKQPHSLAGDQAAAPKCAAGPLWGRVTAWNGNSWANIEDVDVTQGNYNVSTNFLGWYAVCASASGAICMDYNTPAINGVSTLDLVHIQRHILQIAPFDNMPDGARRYVAADANNNGQVTMADVIVLRKLILGITTSLPANNVSFVPNGDLTLSNATNILGFLHNNCRNNASYHMNRRAIKIGDVSGNFSF